MSVEPTVTLTRKEFYDLVWSQPMTTIAAEFGVSGVAFAKKCRRLDVPRPRRGYWQRLVGLKLERKPLPARRDGVPMSITLTRREKQDKSGAPVEISKEQSQKLRDVWAHRKLLTNDLLSMAEASEKALKIQGFLARLDADFPEGKRSKGFPSWFKWARDEAVRLDPLSNPEKIPKQLGPDLDRSEPKSQIAVVASPLSIENGIC